jgi:hypothetical protein
MAVIQLKREISMPQSPFAVGGHNRYARWRIPEDLVTSACSSVRKGFSPTLLRHVISSLRWRSLTGAGHNTSRSDVIHIRELPWIGLRAQLGESSIVEQSSDGVSRLAHEQANRASTQVVAIGARPESRDRRAGDWSKSAIENRENLSLPRPENQFFASSNVVSDGEPGSRLPFARSKTTEIALA